MFPEILTRGDLGISTLKAGLTPFVPPDASLIVRVGAGPTLLVSVIEEGSTAVGDGEFDGPFAALCCGT